MPILRLIDERSFDTELTDIMVKAYEAALAELNLADRNDEITTMLAKAIVEAADLGERDPDKIRQRDLRQLGIDQDAA